MPVTKSAKKALLTSARRHEENLQKKNAYKKAVKTVKKAAAEGVKEITELFSQAQSALDLAAKSKTIHPNKAARLKSRLAKKLNADSAAEGTAKAEKPAKAAKTPKTTKKTASKKTASKK